MKNKFRIAVAALLIALSGYGIGRAQDTDKDADAFRMTRYKAKELGSVEAYAEMTNLVFNAPKSIGATKQAIRNALFEAYNGHGTEADAVLIAQNARIIELLQKLQK